MPNFIVYLLLSSVLIAGKDGYKVTAYLGLNIGASNQVYSNLLGEGIDVESTGWYNDVSGTVYFDDLDNDIKDKLFKKLPKALRGMSSFSTSARQFSSIYNLVPTEFAYKESNDIELLYLNWDIIALGTGFFGLDLSITSIYFNDKASFEEGELKVRPSAGLWLGLSDISFSRKFPISADIAYQWRYLLPSIEFYDDLKFTTIRSEPMLTLNIKVPLKVPIPIDKL